MAPKKPTAKPKAKPKTTKTKKGPTAKRRGDYPKGIEIQARIVLDPLEGNPDYPHAAQVTVFGTTIGTNNENLEGFIRRPGVGPLPVVISPDIFSDNRFAVFIAANTIQNGFDDYILKVRKAGVLPASMVLDTAGA